MNLAEKRHVKSILELERAERKLVAAFARWHRLRAKVRRYDSVAERKLAGEYDQFASLEAGTLVRGARSAKSRRATPAPR